MRWDYETCCLNFVEPIHCCLQSEWVPDYSEYASAEASQDNDSSGDFSGEEKPSNCDSDTSNYSTEPSSDTGRQYQEGRGLSVKAVRNKVSRLHTSVNNNILRHSLYAP